MSFLIEIVASISVAQGSEANSSSCEIFHNMGEGGYVHVKQKHFLTPFERGVRSFADNSEYDAIFITHSLT